MSFKYMGALHGHDGAVTCLAVSDERPDTLVSGSRDKCLLVWDLPRQTECYGRPLRRLHGHSHFISDVSLSSDGRYAVTSSWDGSLRLWNLEKGISTRRFVGHEKDVLAVAFSDNNRQILSGSRDRTARLWNTVGEQKYIFSEGGHSEWVSAVAFGPTEAAEPICVTAGWDNMVKVWSLNEYKLRFDLAGHTASVEALAISPDSSLCASAGKDGKVMCWDLKEGKLLYSIEVGDPITSIAFNPKQFALAVATSKGIKIFELKEKTVKAEIKVIPTEGRNESPICGAEFTSSLKEIVANTICWSPDGKVLYVGCNDKIIRVYEEVADSQ
jgi:guanine nucleotide-binding protein subunit beta-2-like 1 protein